MHAFVLQYISLNSVTGSATDDMMSRRQDNFQQSGSTQANYPVEYPAHQYEGTNAFNQNHQQQEQQWPFYQHHPQGGAFYSSQNTSINQVSPNQVLQSFESNYYGHVGGHSPAAGGYNFLQRESTTPSPSSSSAFHLPPSLSNASLPPTTSDDFHHMASRPNTTVALPSRSSVGFHHMASRPNATVALPPTPSAEQRRNNSSTSRQVNLPPTNSTRELGPANTRPVHAGGDHIAPNASDWKKVLRRLETLIEKQSEQKKDFDEFRKEIGAGGVAQLDVVTEVEGLPLRNLQQLYFYEASLVNEESRKELVRKWKNWLW